MQNIKWAVETIEKFIVESEEMAERSQKAGVDDAYQWANGRRDGLILAKSILQSAGISFSNPGEIREG